MPEDELKELYSFLESGNDLQGFPAYSAIISEMKRIRDPTMTEIRVLDTYWSDHCRHTTFSTELEGCIISNDGYYKSTD